MQNDVAKVAASLSPAQKRVVLVMTDGEHVPPMAQFAADADLPLSEVREAIRGLRAIGLADFGTLLSHDDFRPCGSGYWLTRKGLDVREAIHEAA